MVESNFEGISDLASERDEEQKGLPRNLAKITSNRVLKIDIKAANKGEGHGSPLEKQISAYDPPHG